MSQLLIGAFFFAMRSCEYLNVSGERRTKLLIISNIRFYLRRQLISHDHPDLPLADSVSITFLFQKKEVRDDTITQHRSNDNVLCPVRQWASLVQ